MFYRNKGLRQAKEVLPEMVEFKPKLKGAESSRHVHMEDRAIPQNAKHVQRTEPGESMMPSRKSEEGDE